jgi:hypothetical protein
MDEFEKQFTAEKEFSEEQVGRIIHILTQVLKETQGIHPANFRRVEDQLITGMFEYLSDAAKEEK